MVGLNEMFDWQCSFLLLFLFILSFSPSLLLLPTQGLVSCCHTASLVKPVIKLIFIYIYKRTKTPWKSIVAPNSLLLFTRIV
jgi:hypothetical protein